MVSVAYCLNKQGKTENLRSIFVDTQNKMILGMPVWFINFKENSKKTVCRSLSFKEIRQLVLKSRFSVICL